MAHLLTRLMLDQESYHHYWDKGWLVVEDVFPAEAAERVAVLALAIAEREYANVEAGYLVDRSGDGSVSPRKLDDAFSRDSVFSDFALDPKLRRLASDLLGAQAFPVSDQIFFKPPRHGSAKPYHQDNFYFRCQPADGVVTSWVALDDVDESNGCLRYIDGSHRGPMLPHEAIPGQESYNSAPPAELIDLRRESLATVGKGGVVFHHSNVLHTSHRNESPRWRRAYAINWITSGVTCQTSMLEKAFFKREEFRELFA
jgi:phytanoyl-CoA hydroxylase